MPAPNPEPEAVAASLPAAEEAEDISALLRELLAAFNDKVRFDAGRERIIDRLHAELQEYKDNLVLKVVKSMALDLITLADNLGKWAAAPKEGTPVSLSDVQGDIEDILDRNGFENYTAEGSRFDPHRQRVLRTVPTEDPALDRCIAEHSARDSPTKRR